MKEVMKLFNKKANFNNRFDSIRIFRDYSGCIMNGEGVEIFSFRNMEELKKALKKANKPA